MEALSRPPEDPVRVSYARATAITAISVIITWIVTTLAFIIESPSEEIFIEMIGPAIVMATLIPIFVAFPVAVVLQRERLRVANTLEKLHEAHIELERRAKTDHLTGLLNREAFMNAIEDAQEENRQHALLMIDIDHFKTVNDNYGHRAGDDALRLVATVLSDSVREEDIVGRIGGEEFGVLLADTPLQMANLYAERIRLAIAAIDFKPMSGPRHPITVSIGLALCKPGETVNRTLHLADTCMYRAKGEGRNCVRLALSA